MAEGHRRACLAVSRVGLGTKESLPAFCEIFGKLGWGGGDGVKVQGGLRLVWGVFFSSRPARYFEGGGIWHFYLLMVGICRITYIMEAIFDHATPLSHCNH